MKVTVSKKAIQDATRYGKKAQFESQIKNLKEHGTSYSSLNFEVLSSTKKYRDPHRVYSFRVSGKFRAFCRKQETGEIVVFLVNNHDYKKAR